MLPWNEPEQHVEWAPAHSFVCVGLRRQRMSANSELQTILNYMEKERGIDR